MKLRKEATVRTENDPLLLVLDVDLYNLGIWLRTDNEYFRIEKKHRFVKWFLTIFVVNVFQGYVVFLLVKEQIGRHGSVNEAQALMADKSKKSDLKELPYWVQDLALY